MIPESLETQIDRLLELGFHDAAGLSAAEFADRAGLLEDTFNEHSGENAVLVASAALVGAPKLLERIDRSDGQPETVIHAEDFELYKPIESVDPPDRDFYLLTDFDRAPSTRNTPPKDALKQISDQGRSPLTITEGLAVFAQWPECVWMNDGFSLAGSTRGDKRVPAIWISKKQPKLGWCFLGAPHTWLATASCSGRRVN